MTDETPRSAPGIATKPTVGHAAGGGGHRVQVTVFLEPAVHQAARRRAAEAHLSLSATVAEAAKESLLSSYRSDRERELLRAADRNFHALRRLDGRLRLELALLKEMVGLGVRSFLNHTPAVPESGKAAALLSGKQRFGRYLNLVAANLRGGDSVLGDVAPPEPAEAGLEVTADDDRSDPPIAAPTPSAPAPVKVTAAVTPSAEPRLPPPAKPSDPPRQIGLFDGGVEPAVNPHSGARP